MDKYEIVVNREEDKDYPFMLVDKSTGEVLDAFPDGKTANARLADYRGEPRTDEYGDN